MSRSKEKGDVTYVELDEKILHNFPLIINTTPLGMAPRLDTFPDLPYELLNSRHLLFDLVYNPEKTVFLTRGEERGCPIKNGLEMLHLQAEKAWDIWNQ